MDPNIVSDEEAADDGYDTDAPEDDIPIGEIRVADIMGL
jgi:hypothetical protein